MTFISTERRVTYAKEVAAMAGLLDERLFIAFTKVEREKFLPPGPWMIEAMDGSCYPSIDDDPEKILHAVGIVYDMSRMLHLAAPGRIARALQETHIKAGDRVLQIGAGLGYYSAIIAELVGSEGHVIASEIDPELREKAHYNLRSWSNVDVVGDALTLPLESIDVIFSHCGIASFPEQWKASLMPNGRMTLPVTGRMNSGFLYHFNRVQSSSFCRAKLLSLIHYYPCLGLHQSNDDDVVTEFRIKGLGLNVQSARFDLHPQDDNCLLHQRHWCLRKDDVI